MSLKARIVYILLIVFALYVGLSFLIQQFVVFPRFVALEREKALTDVLRVIHAVQSEISHLEQFCYDWAAWDDTYQFVQDGNSGYINANLLTETFVGNHIDLLYIVDLAGNVVWGKVYDPATREELTLQSFPRKFSRSHLLLAHDSCESSLAGVLLTERGPLLVASRPILTSAEKGPIQGTFIMGRFLDNEIIGALVKQTSVDLALWPARGSTASEIHRRIVEQIRAKGNFLIDVKDKNSLWVYTLYYDVYGMPGLLVRVDVPRDITTRGQEALRFASSSVILAGILVSLITLMLLGQKVVMPLEKLTAHAVAVGRSSDLSARLGLERKDEIGVLAREFDGMVARLAETQKKLLEQSYYSGVAEMATGTLHNLRNALSPMIVQLDALWQKLHGLPIDRVMRARGELGRQDISEQRRVDVERFLNLALDRLSVQLQESVGDVEAIARQAARVEEILAEQDRYTRAERLMELTSVEALLQDALMLVPAGLRGIASIQLDKAIAAIPPMKIQRIILMQVFGNLITNALESIQSSETSDGKITIDAVLEQSDGIALVHVRICDNGVGIAQASLGHIFERGYSTKNRARSGIGLHWCANALAAMKGSIYAESDGPGRGACFHVLFPGSTMDR